MLIVFCSLLMLRVGRCTDDLNFEMMTVEVGHNVTLTCARHDSLLSTFNLFWIRLVSGNMPELLGGTHSFDFDGVDKTSRITAKQGNGTFILHISKAQLSDTGLYYCVTVKNLHMTFVGGTFLRIQGPEPDVTAVIQLPPSDPVHPGDSVTLQCSVLSESQNKPCPGNHSVFWFRAGSDESHPSFIYFHGNSGAECETSHEARSPQKCVYSFSKKVSSSDAGTYYCAVATCGEILFGNGTKLDIEGLNMWNLQMATIVVFLLCAALVISLIVISYLSYTMKKKSCGCCTDAVVETNASDGQQSQQRDEESLTYSAPTFTKRKPRKADRKTVKPAEAETTYSDIRTFVRN
ncbi:signal-regulatory protein beta-2-like [Acanthopagrus schlegelii]